MNANKQSDTDLSKARPPVRSAIRLAMAAILLVSAGTVFIHFMQSSSGPVELAAGGKGQWAEVGGKRSEVGGQGAEVRSQTSEGGDQKSEGRGQATAAANPTQTREQAKPAPATAPLASPPEPTPQTRQLVSSLALLDQAGSPMTPEQATAWKQNFQQLVQQGSDAVPAITEFLKQNKDVNFDAGISDTLGYTSVRRGMIDALAQIGGQEAVSGTLQILQTTADPSEIAILAQNLEKLAPEVYRQEAIRAAREALAMATDRKLEGSDVAPLFEVLHKFGNADVVPDLEQGSKQWNYYSTMALAQLPDGAGIPALIQIAQGDASAKGNAIEMITQMSTQYPDARAALLDMVRANNITPNFWPYLTPLLAGDQYHYQDSPLESSMPTGKRTASGSAYVVFGNQHFYTAPDLARLTTEDINQRMALIDEIQSVTTDPAAAKALQQARDLLTKRTPQTVAVSP